MPFTFAQADDLIQEIDAIFAGSENAKFAILTDRLMKVNTLGVGKTAMAHVKEHLIQLGQNSPHQAALAPLLLLIDIHLLADVQKDGAALLQQALKLNDYDALKVLTQVYGADIETELEPDGNNALQWAVKEGREAAVRFLIEQCKMAVNKPNYEGDTALHWAAERGDSKLVTYLLAHGADVTAQAGNGETPLHRAPRGDHEAICKQLIATGKVNVNATDNLGRTVLHTAAGWGELGLVTYLLTCGANVVTQDSWRGTPLHAAVYGGHKAVCEKLIDVGKADINTKNKQGLTALHLAIEEGYAELVTYLLGCGANVMAQDGQGNTPLHLAAKKNQQVVCEQLLATKKVDVNARNQCGRTALHDAAKNGNPELVACLLEREADVTIKNECDDSSLDLAASHRHRDVFRQLVVAGGAGIISIKDHRGNTVLHKAAELGDLELVRYLVVKGADVIAQNQDGDMPFHMAARKGHKAICELWFDSLQEYVPIKNWHNDNALYLAVMGDYNELVQCLVEKFQADINELNFHNTTVLHHAARNDNPELVAYLLTKGARITARIDGDTPLHWAARYGHKAACEQLILRGKADVNAKNTHGNTALHDAAEYSDSELVEYLLACGADATAQNEIGDTPLHVAAHKGHKAACEQLITRGKADVNAKNTHGDTALHDAAEFSDPELVEYLLACGADARAQNRIAETPLHLAAYKNKAICEQLVATKKVDVNAKNWIGMTALHLAAQERHIELVAYLFVHGADIVAQSKSGVTPLHIAVEEEDIELVKLLLKAGARPNVKTYIPRISVVFFGIKPYISLAISPSNRMIFLRRSVKLVTTCFTNTLATPS